MNKGWKKTLSLLLCLVMLAGLFPAALAEGETYTVVFETGEGMDIPSAVVDPSVGFVLPKAEWDGHVFLGWALEPDGEEDNGWLRVRYASIPHGVVTGWVGADWISQTEPPALAKAKTAVNMREAPGATSFIHSSAASSLRRFSGKSPGA